MGGIQRVQQVEVMSKLQVTDAELKMYYDSHKDSFTTKPQITLREILVVVPTSDRSVNVGQEEEAMARAEDIRKRLVAGEPFARLAADLSDSPSKANGGIMALTRDPSGKRASTIGLASSTCRPNGSTMRWMIVIRWRSSKKRAPVS